MKIINKKGERMIAFLGVLMGLIFLLIMIFSASGCASDSGYTIYRDYNVECTNAAENFLKSKGLNSDKYIIYKLDSSEVNYVSNKPIFQKSDTAEVDYVFGTPIWNNSAQACWKYSIYGNFIPGTILICGKETQPFNEVIHGDYTLEYAYILNIYSNESELIYWWAGSSSEEPAPGFDKLKSSSGRQLLPDSPMDNYQIFDINISKFGHSTYYYGEPQESAAICRFGWCI